MLANPILQKTTAPEFALKETHVSVMCENEKRVVRQLFEALLYEGIVEYCFKGGKFTLNVGKALITAQGQITHFSRVRLNPNSLKIDGVPLTLSHAINVIASLSCSDDKRNKLVNELKHTLLLCRWNQKNLVQMSSRRALSYNRLESALIEGHPYHPCFKSRSGFSVADHEQYGPEAGGTFKLQWLAIKREFLSANFNGETEQSFWKRELGHSTYNYLTDILRQQGGNHQDYGLVPVHPWQYKTIRPLLEQPLANSDVYSLGLAGDDYQASTSLRTLLNTSNVNKASVKLPLNVVNTSSLRTIEPHSVCTAPHISNWLATLINNDEWLQRQNVLSIQKEYAGIALKNPRNDSENSIWATALAPSLSTIFRNASVLNEPNSQTVPFAILASTEQDGKPFVAQLIEKHGVEKWLDALINTAVLPVWHLLVNHGIAVEAHAQNMSLILKDGLPKKVVLRDFHESLEYVPDFIANECSVPEFEKINSDYVNAPFNRYYWMDNIGALRELFVDTVFVYNLAELSFLFSKHSYCSEGFFWSKVAGAIRSYNDSGITDYSRIDRLGLFEPRIITESLLKKKLHAGNAHEEFHHTIENPLAKFFKDTCGESHA
ncbi:IucA/IucC family protein [Alteromonas portus]|uniref:IucA/IucC family protein n=1 Tax=Alteromonas portus TaxID=2565549 RepID=UPI003BF7827C